MSSDNELLDMEADIRELLESDETPPQAFYLALKQALSQVETDAPRSYG